jgi:hypothetical protein
VSAARRRRRGARASGKACASPTRSTSGAAASSHRPTSGETISTTGLVGPQRPRVAASPRRAVLGFSAPPLGPFWAYPG